ncbi:hypothetical protein ACIA49_39060 [Kribbella sp. NPDC051587]|uniref:hypothetical protein n=1 Tax=Kribbella sp. NPDC051587 TaxID=3364119 RepID=UPI00379A57E2
MPRIAAGQLRSRHLVRLGAGPNYVLVSEAHLRDGKVAVTLYNGDQPGSKPHLFFAPTDPVHLSLCPDSADGRWPVGRER